jgi:gas vesicle structural protein
MQDHMLYASKEITICDLLDRVLNKGIVVTGDLVISVADIDLVYVGLKLLVTSVETMRQQQLTVVKRNSD